MYWIAFYYRSTTGFVSGVGDRSVIVVDGRESAATHHDLARSEGRKRGYDAYRICKGPSFTRPDKETGIHLTGLHLTGRKRGPDAYRICNRQTA